MKDVVNSNAAVPGASTVHALLHGNAERASLPRLERTMLLSYASGMTRVALMTHPERLLPGDVVRAFDALCRRRAAGEPMAYIVGEREFFGLNLGTSPAVLIPRPETELLVEAALAVIPEQGPVRLLDLGTGSGAIAIALARHRPMATIVATDVSREALAQAKANALANGANDVDFIVSDWFGALRGPRFDVIVSNPPYIPAGDPHLETGDLRFEPKLALRSGADGLDAIHAISGTAMRWLLPGGWLMLEHGYDQGSRCRDLLERAGFVRAETRRDLAGLERVTFGQAP